MNMRQAIIPTVMGLLALAAPARADLAPDPTDPTNPYVIIALILVVAGLGVFFYRRRVKK